MAGYSLTETAEHELREILLYVRDQSGMERAEHVLGRFIEAFDSMALFPGMGALRPRLTGDEVRWWSVFRYRVLYDPGPRPIIVLRIVHGARDLDRMFRAR